MRKKGSPLKTDEHLVALRGMWAEMKALGRKIDRTNDRIDGLRTDLSARIDETNNRVDALRSDVTRALAETQIRVATDLVAVGRTIDNVTGLLRQRDTDHAEIDELRKRVDRLEERVAR
ncbi:MAG: hypothetical protein QME96_11460 [Myxococcota bacterium]|nr:hypothetical protein [Myxococcota bacterium]